MEEGGRGRGWGLKHVGERSVGKTMWRRGEEGTEGDRE